MTLEQRNEDVGYLTLAGCSRRGPNRDKGMLLIDFITRSTLSLKQISFFTFCVLQKLIKIL